MNLARAVCMECKGELWVRDIYTADDHLAGRPVAALCASCRPKEAYEPWRRKTSTDTDLIRSTSS